MTDRHLGQGSGLQHDVIETRLWDPALRMFHWLLALSVTGAWVLGKFGGNMGITKMTLHFWCGYMVIALLGFRLVWGLVGPAPARFASFVRGPASIAGYAGKLHLREPSYWRGHNPLGALSVIVMLAALAAQVATGMVSDPDDYINVGPLASYVSSATRRSALGWHALLANVIMILVVLHVVMIMFYRLWKREDLLKPMITGKKLVKRTD